MWQPGPKLAVTVDYYKIDIDKAISSPTTTDILDGWVARRDATKACQKEGGYNCQAVASVCTG